MLSCDGFTPPALLQPPPQLELLVSLQPDDDIELLDFNLDDFFNDFEFD
jgi:hypothetical protein